MPQTPPNWITNQFLKLPYPEKSFAGQTIIVTGSNIGVGLEASRHFVRLNAAKVILAVRSLVRGNAAKKDIETTTQNFGVVHVWEVDLNSYASVLAFVEKADRELDRLDILVCNAGMNTVEWEIVEQDEKNITVNVVSTQLLSIALLPLLRKTSISEDKECVLVVTGSFVHFLTDFKERKHAGIFEGLQDKKTAKMKDRYNVSKLIALLCTRELASQQTNSPKGGNVVISTANPGFVATNIMKDFGFFYHLWFTPMKWAMARTPEMGSRPIVYAAEGGKGTHGAYITDCKVTKPSDFVLSEDGLETQKRLWTELAAKLEKIKLGIMQSV